MSAIGDPNYDWVRDYLSKKRPDLVASFLEARRICEMATEDSKLSTENKHRLLEFARNPSALLGQNVAAMLGTLVQTVPEAGLVIRELSTGQHSHERMNAVLALDEGPPTPLHQELLGKLVQDKRRTIRELAADKIVSHGLRELAANLEAALQKEKIPSVAANMKSCLERLLHGFSVKHDGKWIWVTCTLPNRGTVARGFESAEYETNAKAWIAEMLAVQSAA